MSHALNLLEVYPDIKWEKIMKLKK
jgi:hypothetical protein